MKFVLTLFGLVTIFVGVLPYLADKGLLPGVLSNMPTEGTVYQGIIIVIGLLAVLYGLRARERYRYVK